MNKTALTLVTLFVLSFFVSFSQNPVPEIKVSVNFKNKEANDILDVLSKKTGYYFSYNAEVLPENKKISITERNISLKNILDSVFRNNVDYKLLGNHIVITKHNFSENPEQNNRITYKGKIINAETRAAVPFASVGILNTTKGTAANQNGEFILNIPLSLKDSAVYISHIGYKNFSCKIQEDNCPEIIKLSPRYISVEEVIIRSKNPRKIISNLSLNIKNNYLQKPFIITSFYREGVIEKKQIKNYSEAVSYIYKTPYKPTISSDKIKVLKSRKITNTKANDSLKVKLQNGLYASMQLDIVKNMFDFITLTEMPYFDYQLVDITEQNGNLLYIVDFKPYSVKRMPSYEGKLYIDNKNYALIKAEFSINLKRKNPGVNFTVKKSKKYSVIPVSARYSVSYRQFSGKYAINHVRADIVFKIRKKGTAFKTKYRTFFETSAIDYNFTDVKKFERQEILKKNTVFIDNNYIYDASFWGNTNFISPEKPVRNALNDIKAKIILKK